MNPELRAMQKCLPALGLAILLSSCSGTGPPRPAGFEVYDAATVGVTSAVPEAGEQAPALRDSIIEALQEQRVFQSVRSAADEGAAEGLLIEVSITRLRKVLDTLRISMGRMAGSNEVGADITLADAATRRALSTFHLQGESPDYPPAADWPWGSVEDAMTRLSERLAKILRDWRRAPANGG
jgi:hypothetical protein